jgi:hypothetical protein
MDERLLKDYLNCKDPTSYHMTLMYPDYLSKSDVLACIDRLEKKFCLQDWYHVCLYVMKPEWLCNYKGKVEQRSVIQKLFKSVQVFQVVEKAFKQDWYGIPVCTHQLWYLLCTLVVFKKLEVQSMLFPMLEDCTRPYINVYGPLLEGSDWLLDELQEEEGLVYDYLCDLRELSRRDLLDFANMQID